jgi:heptosyltransferase III
MLDLHLRRRIVRNDARATKLYDTRQDVTESIEVDTASADDTFTRSDRSTLTATPSRILICRPNGRLGNTLLLTPLVQELERLFPGAEIDIGSAYPAAAEIFREYACVSTIHQLPRYGVRHPLKMVSTFLSARQINYDLIIDPCPRSRTSRFWTRAMDARADKLGFRSAWKSDGVNCSDSIDVAPSHMGLYPVHLIRKFLDDRTNDFSTLPTPQLSIRLTKAEHEFGVQRLQQLVDATDSRKPVVSLFLNATGNKRLEVPFWQRLVDRLRTDLPALQVVEILAASGQRFLPDWPSYYSSNIRRVAAVISATRWFVSADCGVMHLGAATDASTIGLFKVSDAAKYGPYGANNVAIQVDEGDPDEAIAKISQRISFASQTQIRNDHIRPA